MDFHCPFLPKYQECPKKDAKAVDASSDLTMFLSELSWSNLGYPSIFPPTIALFFSSRGGIPKR